MNRDRWPILLLLVLLNLVVLNLRANATTYTVKAGGGGNYTTISACAAVAVAGDTCLIYAGSYAGWTQPASGTNESRRITFTANTGDTVTVTSGITVSSSSYITISYLALQGRVTGNGSTNHITVTHCTDNTTIFFINDGQGHNGADNVISYNTVNVPTVSNTVGVIAYGDRNRIEHNEFINTDGDCMNLGGLNVVVRDNYCHDVNEASGQHIDFVQVVGGATVTLSFSLLEGNIEKHCYGGGNCHFIQIRASGGQIADTIITRYNYLYDTDNEFAAYGDPTDGNTVPNGHVYNNTVTAGPMINDTGGGAGFANGGAHTRNNIFYNFVTGGTSPILFLSTGDGNGDLAVTTGYSGSWASPYSSEATYSSLHNQDPLFANYPTDGTLQAESPAVGAGVALTTTVGTGTNSTALTVADSRYFQPGWAGTEADWIRVGASTTVQISSIDYTNNIITLANPVSWSNGAGVYLYKDSNGTVVLKGANPDIGAFDPPTSSGAPAPPTNLQAATK